MRIPFDVKFRPQIESGEYKVETRDGKPTRIVCWDLKGNEDFFILALVEKNEKEVSYCYPATGCCKAACDPEGKDDLFLITPEPEFSEFEKGYMRIVHKMKPEDFNDEGLKIAKEEAAELLELARKELLSEKMLIKQTYNPEIHEAHELGRNEGIMLGKAEALKDLPRWRKWENGACGNGRGIPIAIVKRGLNGYELVDALGIQGEQYIMLSDLEKLPGFKEDESHE